MNQKLTINDEDLKGKRVIIRVDFNAPQDKDGNITDDRKISSHLPTIEYAIQHKAKVILISHLSRPEGKRIPSMSLKPMAERLSMLLNKEVVFIDDCIGPTVTSGVMCLKDGEVALLENLRFHREEELDDPEFASKLASLGEIYVNDAFSAAHRAHASTHKISQFFPKALSGYLMKREIDVLSKLFLHPDRPLYLILGGAKLSTKLPIIKHLLNKVDALLIGGKLVLPFLVADGQEIGTPLSEKESNLLPEIRKILNEAKRIQIEIVLPTDFVVVEEISESAQPQIATKIPDGFYVVDIGPQTTAKFVEMIKKAATVFWNGTVGIYEIPQFAKGTQAIVMAIANSDGVTIVGGGDTDLVIDELNLTDKFTHISTGGGAYLEFLEGKELPGISILTDVGG